VRLEALSIPWASTWESHSIDNASSHIEWSQKFVFLTDLFKLLFYLDIRIKQQITILRKENWNFGSFNAARGIVDPMGFH